MNLILQKTASANRTQRTPNREPRAARYVGWLIARIRQRLRHRPGSPSRCGGSCDEHGARGMRGSLYVDAAIAFAILLSVTFSLLALPQLFICKQNIDYMAKAITRHIERNGAAGSSARDLATALAAETGVAASIVWNGDFIGPSERIQLRKQFTVTVSYSARIKLAEPTFAGPLELAIPISKTVTGVSEAYWKTFS